MESAPVHTTLTVEAKTLQVGVNQRRRGGNVMETAPLHTTLTVEAKTLQSGVN